MTSATARSSVVLTVAEVAACVCQLPWLKTLHNLTWLNGDLVADELLK